MSAPKYPWTARQITAALVIVFLEGLLIGALIGAAVAKATGSAA